MATAAERQKKWQGKLAEKGAKWISLAWPQFVGPELRLLADVLIRNPDVSFIPAYRDARGRIHFMKEHR